LNRRKNDASVAAIICAAGSSSRIGGIKKEYRPMPGGFVRHGGHVGGRSGGNLTVLGSAVSVFASVPEITNIVIAVPQNGETAAKNALPQELLAEDARVKIHFVNGGSTRQASVFNALTLLSEKIFGNEPGFVLIHDGARPWLSVSLVERIIEGDKKYRAVIPLQPLIETPKETDMPLYGPQPQSGGGPQPQGGGGPVYIKRHLKRAFIGAAQTPQAFAYPEIFAAHKQAVQDTIEYTDDAEVWAAFYGHTCGPANGGLASGNLVAAIPGENENRKITFAEDFL
jgi:2-C-methyl-D-erythritol 4-phosphate cytidylyltransferase